MTLKQLEAFYLAATLGSFALAAQRLHVTQSSLSKRIAELEAWTGGRLFDRSSKRARLTEAGQRLLSIAAEMLELKETARGALTKEMELRGTCRFGISELGALTWLPTFAARARKEYPHLILHPHVDLGRRLERLVVRGELDFAVIPGPAAAANISSHQVGKVRFAWMAAPGRLRPGTILRPSILSKHPVITMSEGSRLTQVFDEWAIGQGVTMPRIVASNSLMAIIGLTMADAGLSFLPQSFVRPWVEGGSLQMFRSTPALPILPYCFIHRTDDRRSMLPALLASALDVPEYGAAASYSRKTTERTVK